MKIYTKTGDLGETGLFSGKRVSKASSGIEAYGMVDETNSLIGWALVACMDSEIRKDLEAIQNDLHKLCADLATPSDSKNKVERMEKSSSEKLEKLIDKYETELEPLKQFILAGGSELSARLHIARTVCRTAERRIVFHGTLEGCNPEAIIYVNRLSDLLFVLARVANKRAGVHDILWDPKRT